MLNSAIWQGGTLKIAQTVPSARYGVYLYILENYQSSYRSLDVSLEGPTVARGVAST
jgi:hypothetical protein